MNFENLSEKYVFIKSKIRILFFKMVNKITFGNCELKKLPKMSIPSQQTDLGRLALVISTAGFTVAMK